MIVATIITKIIIECKTVDHATEWCEYFCCRLLPRYQCQGVNYVVHQLVNIINNIFSKQITAPVHFHDVPYNTNEISGIIFHSLVFNKRQKKAWCAVNRFIKKRLSFERSSATILSIDLLNGTTGK